MPDAWFHLPTIPRAGERVALDERESRHAAGARRLRQGQRITVFDGRGRTAGATILGSPAKAIEIELGESHIEPPLIPEIHLAAALPKGDRQNVMLNMATQLGIASVTPLICEHSIVKPGRGFADRAQRICIEACKQSGNARLPTIHETASLAETLRDRGGADSTIILAHPGGMTASAAVWQFTADRFTVVIGPEGGFTDAEVALAREAGANIADLGRTIMRTETAAVALVSFLRLGAGGR